MSHWLSRISPAIRLIWRGTFNPGFIEPARYLLDHELVLFLEGECRVVAGEREYVCPPGTFLIIPPDTHHVTYAGRRKAYRFCVHFDWAFQSVFPENLPICTYHPKRPPARLIRRAPKFVPAGVLSGAFDLDSSLIGLTETLSARWFAGSVADRITVRAILLEILLVLLSAPGQSAAAPAGSARDLAYEIKQILDDLSGPPESVRALLEARIGMSYAHLCRLFHKSFGLPPMQYYNTTRIERAKVLLDDPRHSVAGVARSVGFTDPGYFARLFRRNTGVSPRRYARLRGA